MTPQEMQLVDKLFDRLAQLEAGPRDVGAERLIADGLRRAPHAIYALVQTTLLQDEALKRANARIEALQTQAAEGGEPAERPTSFLDNMRAALSGGSPRGSVPNVRSQNRQAQEEPPQSSGPPGTPPQAPPGSAPGLGIGAGGSFLGTAASAAAGAVGGAMLLDGIRSMFGQRSGGFGAGKPSDLRNDQGSPWSGGTGSAAASDLASDAGIDHIGDHTGNAGDGAAATDLLDAADDDQMSVDDDAFGDDDGDLLDGSDFDDADDDADDMGDGSEDV